MSESVWAKVIGGVILFSILPLLIGEWDSVMFGYTSRIFFVGDILADIVLIWFFVAYWPWGGKPEKPSHHP